MREPRENGNFKFCLNVDELENVLAEKQFKTEKF